MQSAVGQHAPGAFDLVGVWGEREQVIVFALFVAFVKQFVQLYL